MSIATPPDSPLLADCFLSAFAHPIDRKMFPPSPAVRAWWINCFDRDIRDPSTAVLVYRPSSVDTNNTNGDSNDNDNDHIAAFAVWRYPDTSTTSTTQQQQKKKDRNDNGIENDSQCSFPLSSLPPECDIALCRSFFSTMEAMKKTIMGRRRFYYLEMLATHPSHRGQGLSSRLLQWSLDKAETEQVPVYLCSTPMGKGLYESRGFENRGCRRIETQKSASTSTSERRNGDGDEEEENGFVQSYLVWEPTAHSENY